jgi:hypothetical protein
MRIRSSGLLILLAACAAEPGKPPPRDVGKPAPAEGKACKITYYRFQQMANNIVGGNPQGQELKAHYYVMLSRGWKAKHGSRAGEPFEKTVEHPSKGEDIGDEVLEQLASELVASGWNDLPSFDLSKLTPAQLFQAERLAKRSEAVAAQNRYITVETPAARKTVCVADVLVLGSDMARKFRECEKVVLKTAMQYTIQVSVGTTPIIPK